jgi:uncharacterized membrane protein
MHTRRRTSPLQLTLPQTPPRFQRACGRRREPSNVTVPAVPSSTPAASAGTRMPTAARCDTRRVKTIEAAETTSASPADVWALLEDAPEWARWGSWSEVEVEGGGPQRPGAERILVRRPYRVRERITEMVPGERFAYELLDGMRVRGYRATVTLDEAPGGGTLVRWRSSYDRAGPFTALLLRLAVRDSCKRLAKAASS